MRQPPERDDVLDRHRERQLGELRNDRDRAGRRPAGRRDPIGSPHRSTLPGVGLEDPVSARSSVDLPAPFGPTRARRSPGAMTRSSAVTMIRGRGTRSSRRRATIGGVDGIGSTRSQLVPRPGPAQQEQEERRSEERHHDADRDVADQPGDEVRGTSRPRRPSRTAAHPAARSARPTSRTTCGTTSPTNPMSPLIATAAAVASDARPSRIAALAADVDAEMRRRRVAQQEAVERPCSWQDQRHAPSRISGAATAAASTRRRREPAQQEREDLAQVGARHVHRHRQAAPRGSSRPRSRSAAAW